MTYSERALLKLHVEAVWTVRLPDALTGDVTVLPGSSVPPWALYVAHLTGGSEVRIWREDLPDPQRSALLRRARATLSQDQVAIAGEGISHEVALAHVAPPAHLPTLTGCVLRRINHDEHALVETFDPGSTDYYLDDPHRWPVIGVIRDGRLLCVGHSSRRTAHACELGIETLPQARRRGYALAATVLWTIEVAAEGLVPLYSARADNTASLALARRRVPAFCPGRDRGELRCPAHPCTRLSYSRSSHGRFGSCFDTPCCRPL